jgi:predicted SAM-dependent methyltransferase
MDRALEDRLRAGARGVLRTRDAVRAGVRDRRQAAADRKRLAELRGRRELRINMGSSSSHLDGWISVDLLGDPEGVAIRFDGAKPWPLDAGSAEAINSEHFLEHLDPADAPRYFAEAYRVLRPGGVIRTSTPDLEGLCRVYADRDPVALATHREHGYTARNHADLVNNYAYSWGHRHLYDFETLEALLHAAGFRDVRRAAYRDSEHEVLRGIDRHDMGPLARIVVAVDAVKPA